MEYAEPNYIIEAESVPDDWPYAQSQWSIVQLPQAWDILAETGSDESITIAVIDSGVDLDHPDLAGALTSGYDFANNDAMPDDDSGHGTRVCGIIGALGNNGGGVAGIAWNADVRIMPLKFMKYNDGKTTGSVSDAINAIYYAVDNGADIINASWGFTSYSQSLADAIAYAQSHGVLFMASAGNSSQDNDTKEHYPSNYGLDNIIAVAAMNSSGDIASFSNYGKTSVDIAAPGSGLSTTDKDGGYVSYVSGTSYATPFAAAVAAMIKSQNPTIHYLDLKDVLLSSVAKNNGAKMDQIVSGGCVDAYQALLAEQSLDSSEREASSSQQAQGSAPVAAAEGGGGGGGCMIETSSNSGSMMILFAGLITAVLFRMPCARRLG